jgi:CHAT domain-containing protein
MMLARRIQVQMVATCSIRLVALLLLATVAARSAAADGSPALALQLQRGGHFEHALQEWRRLTAVAAAQDDSAAQADALLGQSQAYRDLGHAPEALEAALGALRRAESLGDPSRAALAHRLAGSALLSAGQAAQARKSLQSALSLAGSRADIVAAIHNDLGNLLQDEGRYDEALASYRQSIALAETNSLTLLHAQALLNTARAAINGGKDQSAQAWLAAAATIADQLPPSHDKAFALIALGQLLEQQQSTSIGASPHQAYRGALKVAETIGDARAQSFALGYLGHLYESERRFAEAAQLTRRAIFAAQDPAAAHLLYRWHWQNGRLLKAQHRMDDAISAYRLAVHHLQSIRADLALSFTADSGNFREVLGPVFFQLADLLLTRSAESNDGSQVARLLDEARATIELSKAAELQDYFQDGCVLEQQARVARLEQAPKGVAVIYPILLPERTEILMTFSGGAKQFTVPVGAAAITAVIRDFRLKLEKRTTRQYLAPAQKLYDILIRPLEAELQAREIDTLVFVPDGPLRTVPMAALHDGMEFLIARYALATTPGMALTETRPFEHKNLQVLLNGITLPVQGFPSLPSVSDELLAIQRLYPTKTLKDQEFLVENVERELGSMPFSVVHIASHGEFDRDVNQTFLLAFDEKLTMNRLERLIAPSRYRKQPIEMLTLSACQTAAGDDRAALGLAGVAIKAGARSAVASLWYINDESTATLMADFYSVVRERGVTKANALRRAQLALLGDNRFKHPYFWAPFLLIGNWL